jgi:hypothetical protein
MGKQPFLPRGDIYDLKANAFMALADLLGEDARRSAGLARLR